MHTQIILRIIDALWFILPAYVANSTPVNVSKIQFLERYGKPIDFGRSWRGARILGDGKTWRGLFSGILAGTVVGFLQSEFQYRVILSLESIFRDQVIDLPRMSVGLGFMLSLGAIIGDMTGSFVKRRMNIDPGDPAPLLDQLDFVFGAFFFSWLLTGLLNLEHFFIIVLITPAIHLLGNFIAFVWKLKREPW